MTTVLLGAATAMSWVAVAPLAAQEPAHTVAEMAAHATATVEKVDVRNRELTLRSQDGQVFVVEVPQTVRRLDQLKPGDRVDVDYYRSVAVALQKPGSPPPQMSAQESTQPAPGPQPGGTMVGQSTADVEVIAINPQTNELTVRTPSGATATFTVQKPENQAKLRTLHRGDHIQVTHTEAMAVSVTPAK